MKNFRWHILREENTLTMARRLPVRFDLSANTRLPDASRMKIAHQVRQDVWRVLQNIRGFAPVVRVERTSQGLEVTAGGQVDGCFPRQQAEAQIADVLSNPANRKRWVRWAS